MAPTRHHNKKHKLYNIQEYKLYKNISVQDTRHAKVAREAQIEMRRAKRSFEKKLAMNIDSDRKSFYAYVRNRSRVKPSVGPLSNDSDDTLVQGQDMANYLMNTLSPFSQLKTLHMSLRLNHCFMAMRATGFVTYTSMRTW